MTVHSWRIVVRIKCLACGRSSTYVSTSHFCCFCYHHHHHHLQHWDTSIIPEPTGWQGTDYLWVHRVIHPSVSWTSKGMSSVKGWQPPNQCDLVAWLWWTSSQPPYCKASNRGVLSSVWRTSSRGDPGLCLPRWAPRASAHLCLGSSIDRG